jgi:hypothetical protein
MKIDVNNALTIATLAFMLVGGIYRLAKIEENINSKISRTEKHLLDAIDSVNDKFVGKFYETDKKIDIHLALYEEHKLFTEGRINDLKVVIEHKFIRLAHWINQISDLLYEHYKFRIKDDKF